MPDVEWLLPAQQGNPTNLQRSVADWLFGTYAATGASVKDGAGVARRFCELYPAAALIQRQLGGDADQSLDELLANASSPVMAVSVPFLSDAQGFAGGEAWRETWALEFDLYVTIYREGGQRRRDGRASLQQMAELCDHLPRLLRARDGHCPLRDYVAATAASAQPTLDAYDLGHVLVQPLATIPRPSEDMISVTLMLTMLRGAD